MERVRSAAVVAMLLLGAIGPLSACTPRTAPTAPVTRDYCTEDCMLRPPGYRPPRPVALERGHAVHVSMDGLGASVSAKVTLTGLSYRRSVGTLRAGPDEVVILLSLAVRNVGGQDPYDTSLWFNPTADLQQNAEWEGTDGRHLICDYRSVFGADPKPEFPYYLKPGQVASGKVVYIVPRLPGRLNLSIAAGGTPVFVRLRPSPAPGARRVSRCHS